MTVPQGFFKSFKKFAIIQTQRHIQGSVVEKLMKLECEYRNLKFED